MSVWLWILVGVVGVVVLIPLFIFLGGVIQDRLENRRLMKDPVYMQSFDSMIARTLAGAQRATGSGHRSTHAGIPELIRANSISGLLREFSLADSWETRELVVVALGNVCRDAKQGTDYERPEMVAALQSIIELCKAESSGGSYRENCIAHAQMLLKRFD